MRIMTFLAHPDDEVLGCGATLSKFDREIHVVIPATGIYAREDIQETDHIELI